MAYLGNSPGVASQRIPDVFTCDEGQTTFTPSYGYTVGYCDVSMNGVDLINGIDFTAEDGVTVVLTSPATENDIIATTCWIPRGLSDGYLKSEADSRFLKLSGGELTGNLSQSAGVMFPFEVKMGDGKKIRLGESNDLEIYHTGNNAYITDTGTGDINITSNGSGINLMTSNLQEYMATFATDGAVTLYNDGNPRLATASTGVVVSGTVNTDDLVIENLSGGGKARIRGLDASLWLDVTSGNNAKIYYDSGDLEIRSGWPTDSTIRMVVAQSGNVGIRTTNTTYGTLSLMTDANGRAISIFENNGNAESWQIGVDADGDLNFHNSGSTTPSISFNDSGYVGIGTTNPSAKLTVNGGDTVLKLTDTRTTSSNTVYSHGIRFSQFHDYDNGIYFEHNDYWGITKNAMAFKVGNGEKVRINYTGNVGIGTASPSTKLHIANGSDGDIVTIHGSSDGRLLKISSYNTGSVGAGYNFNATSVSGELSFSTTGNRRLTINNNGRIFLGESTTFLNGFGAEDVSAMMVSGGTNQYVTINTHSANAALYLTRSASATTQTILNFADSGQGAGHVRTATKSGQNAIYMGLGNTNLYFYNPGRAVLPVNSSGLDTNNEIDLGASWAAFKDVHADGVVYTPKIESPTGGIAVGTQSDSNFFGGVQRATTRQTSIYGGSNWSRVAWLQHRQPYRVTISTMGGSFSPGSVTFYMQVSWSGAALAVSGTVKVLSQYITAVRVNTNNTGSGGYYFEVYCVGASAYGPTITIEPLTPTENNVQLVSWPTHVVNPSSLTYVNQVNL